MKIQILEECGINSALLGLSLSYNQPIEKMPAVAKKLCSKKAVDSGELKFLEMMMVWLDVTAPRYWWAETDTYRVGVTKQSESTMHTLTKKPLEQSDFIEPIPETHLYYLNGLISNRRLIKAKQNLPEGFLQRRIVMTSYKVLLHIIKQRYNHKLEEWQIFNNYLLKNLQHSDYITLNL